MTTILAASYKLDAFQLSGYVCALTVRHSPLRKGFAHAGSFMQSGKQTVEDRTETLVHRFGQLFGTPAQIYQAPGRVNLIGEHTDYNDGFVMPVAVGYYTRSAIAPRNDRKLVIHSQNFSEQIELRLDRLPSKGAGHWSDYVVGTAKMLVEAGNHLTGANVLLQGDVPMGAGLSSSASLEVVAGYALLDVAGLAIDRTKLALVCQRAENEFVGARCGIMDQFICSQGKLGHATLLDCRSLESRLLPLPENVRLVVCNTMIKHTISGGEYNHRRADCEAGMRLLSKHLPNVRALRDVTQAGLEEWGGTLPETIFRRCRHVITENFRVQQAAAALERNDTKAFGNLMRQSQQSLRNDFEVSCSELDLMVRLAEEAEGVYGARMTGGGFGGCTVNLVEAEYVESFKHNVAEGYEDATRLKPEIYVCSAVEGVGPVV